MLTHLIVLQASLDDGWWQMKAHPLNESPASIFPFLSESFYSLLQTISDIMPVLPIGSPLLEMAVKCWGVYFTRKDHRFLHKYAQSNYSLNTEFSVQQ